MKHVTLLDGLKFDATPRSEVFAPSLLRYDLGPEVIETFYNDLRQDDWLDRLKARSDLEVRDGLPVVDQPVHRKAVLVVVDAACLTPGFPRLDMEKVAEAGLVIRREASEGDLAPEGVEIWASDATGKPLGWLGAPAGATASASGFEPDATLRRARLAGKNPALKFSARLTGDAEGVSETVHPLSPIPEEIAATIGRTIYFALLPTSSMAVQPAEAPPPPFSLDDVKARLPNMLRADRDAGQLPPANDTISQADYRNATDPGVAALRTTLTWLGQENGLFTGAETAEPLRAALAQIPISGAAQTNLRDWFDAANAILVERRNPADGVTVSYTDRTAGPSSIATPTTWPAIPGATFDALAQAAYGAMAARWTTLSPVINRFGPPGDSYHVRCFLRIDDHPGCPPRLLWSPLSKSYLIRPGFESGGAPPQQIDLPSLKDLSAFKPDVAIKVPPEIQQFMDKLSMEKLMDGEAPKTSISFGMICGFSIPIITICAFIILQIFLALLNIIFFWLPFVKICIPYPIVETEEDGG